MISKYVQHINAYTRMTRDGTPVRLGWHYFAPFTALNTCQKCGVMKTPKKVHYRSWSASWHPSESNQGVLCMGCWNQVRGLVKKSNEAEGLQVYINRLKKEIRDERKKRNQDNGRVARLSGDDDGRG